MIFRVGKSFRQISILICESYILFDLASSGKSLLKYDGVIMQQRLRETRHPEF